MAMTSRHARVETPSDSRREVASVRVEARATGAHLLLVLSGEADLYTAQALRDDLSAALITRPCSVALELSGVTYCDLAGLDALNDFCAEASAAGVPPVVRGMSSRLAWMHATVPGASGTPTSADRSAPAILGSPDLRWSPDATRHGAAPVGSATPPRTWPER